MAEPGSAFRRFLLLWSGELVSSIGSGLSAFGLSVYAYRLTGRASAVALVTLLGFLPGVLLGAPAGVLADRRDRRLLMVAGDLSSALGPLFILACLARGEAALWQVCAGAAFGSACSSLVEPAYRATLSDLLSEEDYTRAAGLVNAAASAKYLVAPALAGYLLTVADLRLLLALDAGTFLLTCLSTLAVRRGIAARHEGRPEPFLASLRSGWAAIASRRGLPALLLAATAVTFFLGFMQTLLAPMILAFESAAALGLIETVSACGMLASGLLLGLFPIRAGHQRVLSAALLLAGLAMVLCGLRENAVLICAAGFLFFAMLPPANACLDYLVRTRLDKGLQGRAWGLVGLVSQSGYLAAYASVGVLADSAFTPALLAGSPLSASVGALFGTGPGRGSGLMIAVAGTLLGATALALGKAGSLREPEREVACTAA